MASITAYKRSSLVSNNYPFSSRLYLILAVVLASYPQSASAAPKAGLPRNVRRSRKRLANLVDQSDAQPVVMERKRRGINRRGTSLEDIANAWNQFLNGGGNVNAQEDNNNNNNGHHSPSPTPPRNQVPPPSSPSKTTSTHAQTSTKPPAATSPAQQPATSSPHSTSPATSDDASETMNDEQTQSSIPPPGGPSPNGPSNTSPQQNQPTGNGQPQPWNGASYHDPGENSTASIATNGTSSSSQSRVNKGLVAGLVVSLVILLAFCALAAFFVARRMRKKRREREESSPFNDTAPWLQEKQGQPSEFAETEKTSTREGSPESSLSRMQSISSEPRMRARTPGGSSAVPVPYDPSEVSDDVSAHFTFFPQDDAIGVPVPYPLALHVPARVAQAMADRDARWIEYEELRRQQKHARSSSMASTRTPSDIVTIPDRPELSRRTTQRSTTDSLMSNDTGLYGISRSDVGVYGHDDVRSQHAAEGRESLLSVADFPIPPPPPASIRPQSWRIRRASAAPSQLRSVSENPFATEADLESSESTNIGARRLSDEMTATQHGDSYRIPRGRPADNPFDDERTLTRDSEVYAGVIEHQTVDGHDSVVFAFPAPPTPLRRPS